MKTLLTPTPLIACEEKYLNRVLDELPDGNYSVIGTVDKGIIDFDVTEYLIDRIDIDNSNYDNAYFHFGDNKTTGWSAENCFLSLLESHSLSLDKKYLIIKQK